ncbi:MAG: site-specific integrase [Bacteroidia bacterium]|nr:site-specific integrase [Bacteroidia bacterium]
MKAHVKLILDYRSKRLDGNCRISLRLTHHRVPLLIGTDYLVNPDDWDIEACRIKPGCKLYKNLVRVNNGLTRFRMNAEEVIDYLTSQGEIDNIPPAELKIRILNKNKRFSFREFNQKIIEELKMSNKLGNAFAYEQAQKFLDRNTNNRELYFEDINYQLLKKLEAQHLSRNKTLNSLSFYLRTIRATYNRAIKEGLVKLDLYPFTNYSIKETKTVKRAIRKTDIEKIRDIVLEPNNPLWHARNYFMFSFYCIGMNFSDMAQLKKSSITEDRMIYIRAKTGKAYSVKLTAPAKEILSHYLIDQAADDYVFPIIKRNGLELQMKDMQNDRKTFNKYLKRLGKMCGIEANLTSYVARHSWATIAKDLNVPISVISEGLGHEDIKTTQIYLDSFDADVIDKANQLISG